MARRTAAGSIPTLSVSGNVGLACELSLQDADYDPFFVLAIFDDSCPGHSPDPHSFEIDVRSGSSFKFIRGVFWPSSRPAWSPVFLRSSQRRGLRVPVPVESAAAAV
jgi:hypothetical protein